jgi:hypothetical protein
MAAVLGIAFMHFRKSQSLTITGTKHQLSGWLFLALFALIAGIDFAVDDLFRHRFISSTWLIFCVRNDSLCYV